MDVFFICQFFSETFFRNFLLLSFFLSFSLLLFLFSSVVAVVGSKVCVLILPFETSAPICWLYPGGSSFDVDAV